MIFVFDENILPGLVAALRGAGEHARHITEELGRGSQDVNVFGFLGRHGCYLVTADVRISRNPQQRAALIASGIGAFFFTGKAKRNPF